MLSDSFLLAFHEVSVYPKKELPFFILFTAGLCSFTALLALLTHHYPEPMGYIARTVSIKMFLKPKFTCMAIKSIYYFPIQVINGVSLPLFYILGKLEALCPSSLLQHLSRI